MLKLLNERAGKPNCFDEAVLKTFETIDSNRESCPLCSSTFQGRYMLLRHLADCHFRERLCQGMMTSDGSSTYKCPECSHESKDKGGFVRHYGLVHKMVQKWLKVHFVKQRELHLIWTLHSSKIESNYRAVLSKWGGSEIYIGYKNPFNTKYNIDLFDASFVIIIWLNLQHNSDQFVHLQALF